MENEQQSETAPPPETPIRVKRLSLWLVLGILTLLVIIATLLWRPPRPQPIPFDTLHPHTQQALLRLGVQPERVAQGLGLAPASAGIHGVDGYVGGRPYCAAFDLSVADLTPQQTRDLLDKLRGEGLVCWWRVPGVSFPITTWNGVENGPHIHGIDPFIPHKKRLELQIRDYIAGNNGIEVGRYAHRPDPSAAHPQTSAEQNLLRQMRRDFDRRQARMNRMLHSRLLVRS